MGLPIPASVIEHLGHDMISKLSVPDLIKQVESSVTHHLEALPAEDKAAIAADFATALHSLEDVVHRIQAHPAHQ